MRKSYARFIPLLLIAIILSGCTSNEAKETASPIPTSTSSVPAIPVSVIDWNQEKQAIDGFGASAAFIETLGPKGFQNYAEPARSQILDLLFSREKGIGLSWVRNRVPQIEPVEGTWDWSKDPGQLFMMNEAKKRGVTRFYSTVWSPPGWMKTNNNAEDGNSFLLPDKFQAYADYLSKYAREYKSQFNIDLYGVSIQNEPDNAPNYEGNMWSAGDFNNFIKDYLGPTFTKDGVTAKIMLPESKDWNENLAVDALNDPETVKYIDTVTAHPYDGGFQALPTAKSKGKKVWATEVSSYEGQNDASMTDAMKNAILMHRHMTVAEDNAFFYWWLLTDSAAGGQGLINIYKDNSSYSTNKRLFTFGNFSRFIQPGAVRIDATPEPASGIYVSAYKDPSTGKLTVVAINDNEANQDISFQLKGAPGKTFVPYTTSASQNLAKGTGIEVKDGAFTASLPSKSVTTLIDADTDASGFVDSFADVEPQTTAPGETASVPAPEASPIPDPVVMTDALDNWNKTISHTANLQLTNIGEKSTDGDKSVAQRKTNTTESFIYQIEDIRLANIKMYFNDPGSDSNHIKVYASSKNGGYKEVETSQDEPAATEGSWYRVNYAAASLPANTNFLKIEIPQNTKDFYTPVISEVNITSSKPKSAAEKPKNVMTDPMDDWKKTLSHTDNLQLTNIGADSVDGDTSVVQRKTNTSESFIYNIKKMKTANVKIYFNDPNSDSNNIKIYGSSTNGKFKELVVRKDDPAETKGYWYAVNYTVDSIPENTNFLKIEIPQNTKDYYTPVISEVQIGN
ncbi:glycoside hydrolase family 30 protein [Cohnella yongneupensis]|uniref:Glycoside hydrolase n=1 Tax=Cohnella yongneupensis TaxID=425006 RepID=A0ABW0R2W2_9BACL